MTLSQFYSYACIFALGSARLGADLCPRRRRRAALFRFPSLELLEQGLAVGIRLDVSRCRVRLQELVEPAAHGAGGDAVFVEPFACGRQALPTRQRRRQRDFLPLRMERRILEFREL